MSSIADIAPETWVRVNYGDALNLRPEPTINLARLDVVSPLTELEIIAGPDCNDGYVWWQVQFNDTSGWVAEGNTTDTDIWLSPLGKIISIREDDTITRRYRVDAQGEIIERAGCMRPPDDYTQIIWGYAQFNVRTVAMLQQAQHIFHQYENAQNIRFEDQIVQGSYNPGVVAASFGTHDAGGAVDISVRSRDDYSVMTDQIPLMLDALRTAGFAAWLREEGELYEGSSIHIHAIAIGDAEHSPAARGQIDGAFGYLRGYNGLPQDEGKPPIKDRYGDPVICQWMIEAGFDDLRD